MCEEKDIQNATCRIRHSVRLCLCKSSRANGGGEGAAPWMEGLAGAISFDGLYGCGAYGGDTAVVKVKPL